MIIGMLSSSRGYLLPTVIFSSNCHCLSFYLRKKNCYLSFYVIGKGMSFRGKPFPLSGSCMHTNAWNSSLLLSWMKKRFIMKKICWCQIHNAGEQLWFILSLARDFQFASSPKLPWPSHKDNFKGGHKAIGNKVWFSVWTLVDMAEYFYIVQTFVFTSFSSWISAWVLNSSSIRA